MVELPPGPSFSLPPAPVPMPKVASVDEYIASKPAWSTGLTALREVALSAGLEETIKWGAPCYMHAGRNVITLAGFKNDFALWFHDAKELEDPDDVLRQAEGGKSETMRQWRFASAKDVKKRALKSYLKRAMVLAEGPRTKKPRAGAPTELPAELAAALDGAEGGHEAFATLTPGRQREYVAHVGDAKREATRVSRAGKALPKILEGVGLNDHYKGC